MRTAPVRSLEEVIHDTIFNSRGGVNAKEISHVAGISYNRLSNWANPNQDEANLPAKHIVKVTNAAKDTGIVEYLSREVGGVFLPLPVDVDQIESSISDDPTATLLNLMSKIGRLTDTYQNAIPDGINDSEASRLDKDANEVIETAVRLSFALRAARK